MIGWRGSIQMGALVRFKLAKFILLRAFVLFVAASSWLQSASAQDACTQPGVFCEPVKEGPWAYSAYYTNYFGAKGPFTSPESAYAALVAVSPPYFGDNCDVKVSGLSEFTRHPEMPDNYKWATVTLTYGVKDVSKYGCNGYGFGSMTGYITASREVNCPAGSRYIYREGGSVCVSPKRSVVVIDPGHGVACPLIGQAPGAVGVTDFPPSNPPPGVMIEDNLTVAISLEAARLLSSKYRVILTKKDAVTCPTFKERGAFANNANAKLFVSVHINAAKTLLGIPFNNGTSVLYNSSKLKAPGVADNMSRAVSLNLGTNNRGPMVENSIAVLKPTVTNMTAVLLETARLSGSDEQILHASGSATKVAAGIQSAVQAYIGN